MPNVNRREQLVDELSELGVEATPANPTGRKLEWSLTHDRISDDLTGLSTAEVEAFRVGLRLGLATAPARSAERKMRVPHPHRRALIEDGAVKVEIPTDATAEDLKRLRNGLFAHGYALGLKGRFSVALVEERGKRYLEAEATQGPDDEALVEARARLARSAS
jgi:hypothetical protein